MLIRIGLLLLMLIPNVGYSQSEVVYGGLFPELALTKKLNEKYAATIKIESQHWQFYTDELQDTEYKYLHYRTDLQGFISQKFNPFWKVAMGYQYRLEEDDTHHRYIQQVSYVQRLLGLSLGHRVRLDQTFVENEDLEFRVRYRLSSEIPLQGTSLDVKEYYLILSEEVIYGIQGSTEDIENRLIASLGRLVTKKVKLEAGIDHRLDRVLRAGSRQRIWLRFGAFLTL